MHPTVEPFFDAATWTVSYVVYEQDGTDCAVRRVKRPVSLAGNCGWARAEMGCNR